MIQTLTRNWWLVGLYGVLIAGMSVIYFVMLGADEPLTLPAWKSVVEILGTLTLAAAVCAIAAGTWRSSTGKCWLMVLNGLALGALGVTYSFLIRFPIKLRTVALLIILMALSAGALELIIARTLLRRHLIADGWVSGMAGVVSIGFTLPFLALGFGWVRLGPMSHLDLLWFGVYFGFSAFCMLGLALRLHRPDFLRSGRHGDSPSLGYTGNAS